MKDIIGQVEKPLATINFVGEILERSNGYSQSRRMVEERDERMLPPEDLIPPEKLKKLVHDFVESLKEVEMSEKEIAEDFAEFKKRMAAKLKVLGREAM